MNDRHYCPRCKEHVLMEKQDYRNPYITRSGRMFHNILVDVYKCPICNFEKEILPNEEDGYSLGAGLLEED